MKIDRGVVSDFVICGRIKEDLILLLSVSASFGKD